AANANANALPANNNAVQPAHHQQGGGLGAGIAGIAAQQLLGPPANMPPGLQQALAQLQHQHALTQLHHQQGGANGNVHGLGHGHGRPAAQVPANGHPLLSTGIAGTPAQPVTAAIIAHSPAAAGPAQTTAPPAAPVSHLGLTLIPNHPLPAHHLIPAPHLHPPPPTAAAAAAHHPAAAPAPVAAPPPAAPGVAAHPNNPNNPNPPHNARESNRVFKLQFDARRIVCCSQHRVIVGWDFANGERELERVGGWSVETS
ncbi:hypothetical protein B0A55_13317, partial [Friedmanniomyces simplex]